ncbi:MAG: hypothetical protein AAGB24_11835 [Bacteroidota bacterium]
MSSYQEIIDKLDQFTRKYYVKLLVKGLLLFFAFGLLIFLGLLSIEYFLWMGTTARFVLFVLLLALECYFLFKLIIIPLTFLFKLRKGISNKEASLVIGRHFKEVNDKLFNLLDLAEDNNRSELLLASIEQRSKVLRLVPFIKAIKLKESLRYARYTVVPFAILLLLWISGNLAAFFSSYERVVNYDLAYEPPAPFTFHLLSDKLTVLDNEPLMLRMITKGDIKPEQVFVVVDGQQLQMQFKGGNHEYIFTPPIQSSSFYFLANGHTSRLYQMRSLKTPYVKDFYVELDYPDYTKKSNDIIKGTGNAIFPEGTKVRWNVLSAYTDTVTMTTNDTIALFSKQDEEFVYTKRVFDPLQYSISLSNLNIADFETLSYSFRIIKDTYPTIEVEEVLDSLNPNQAFYTGLAEDDYLIQKINLVCYPIDNIEAKQRLVLSTPTSNVDQFYYTFPSGLNLIKGKKYELFFEVIDNDGIHGGKISKSKVFKRYYLEDNDLIDRNLEFQESVLQHMDTSLDRLKNQKKELNDIQESQKQKEGFSFNDKKQVKDFLRRQKEQEQMMEKFSKQLKESLNKSVAKNEADKKLLRERLERQELEALKNAKLIEELNKVADKIDKEDLRKRLEELSKNQSNSERNLEQLLELTKRYYVREKASQLAKDLESLSKEQEELSKLKYGEEFTIEEQKKLNNEYKSLSEELDELKKDNQKLQKPLDLSIDTKKQTGAGQDQMEATEELNKQEIDRLSQEKRPIGDSNEKASQKQKSAAQKMKELSNSLQQGAAMGGGSSIVEDAEMLRQILDNLVSFSFNQEALFDKVQNTDLNVSVFSSMVKNQNELRTLFEHVDDSLFALSLRRAELSEFVNEQVTEVYYNIDKSLESITDNQLYQGASYQQYVINAGNALADFLANILDNMNQSMQAGKGSGNGQSDFQLPDIIKGQGALQEKMDIMAGQQKGSKQGKSDGGVTEPTGGEEKDGIGEQGIKQDMQRGNGNTEGEQRSQAPSEEELKELYEIYKEQQFLRSQLEQQLNDIIEIDKRDLVKKLARQMENFENDLLENGVTQRTLNKMNVIQQQLLKLERATLKQGEQRKREGETTKRQHNNPIITKPELLNEYGDDIEILNRQTLPLRQNYQDRVKEYFQNDSLPLRDRL